MYCKCETGDISFCKEKVSVTCMQWGKDRFSILIPDKTIGYEGNQRVILIVAEFYLKKGCERPIVQFGVRLKSMDSDNRLRWN